ncbi:hypothetical protein 7F7_9 [uncultured Caudovirales phage]|uniref:Uncharacterized protein n=1 Tax=uncultured Caudovirales phage TaxID=2100421 RepID=A0A2H4J771_9CAUD|nr:hypothetical protein 7F7_9 [uncultured Caudovirales phage]
MNWLLFLRYIDDKYHIVQAGSDIVPTEDFDKVLPTTERISRQSDKVYFDGEKLKLKDGETLLSVEELNELKESPLEEIERNTQPVIFDIE